MAAGGHLLYGLQPVRGTVEATTLISRLDRSPEPHGEGVLQLIVGLHVVPECLSQGLSQPLLRVRRVGCSNTNEYDTHQDRCVGQEQVPGLGCIPGLECRTCPPQAGEESEGEEAAQEEEEQLGRS